MNKNDLIWNLGIKYGLPSDFKRYKSTKMLFNSITGFLDNQAMFTMIAFGKEDERAKQSLLNSENFVKEAFAIGFIRESNKGNSKSNNKY